MKNFLSLIAFFGMTGLSRSQVSLPYYNDFETDTTGWFTGSASASVWEWGPAGGLPGKCLGLKGWGIGLQNTQSSANTFFILYSPVFSASSSLNPVLSIRHHFDMELWAEGVWIEHSPDGMPWQLLGDFSLGSNWYNSPNISGIMHPGWAGSSAVCVNSQYSLASLGISNTVQFRFIFYSFNSTVSNDYYLEEICICYAPCNCNPLSLQEVSGFEVNFILNPEFESISILHKGIKYGQAELFDATGKRSALKNLDPEKTKLSTSGLAPGVYMIRISTGNEQYSRRVVIQR